MRLGSRAFGIWLIALLMASCSNEKAAPEPSFIADVLQVPQLTVAVVRRLPHDPTAYTQGLVLHDGQLLESTGRYGESTVRVIDPATGVVLRSHALPATVFGEGLAATADHIVQLTWKELTAYVYDFESFEVQKRLRYGGEGWGLCFDGTDLYMTNGGDQLVRRDAVSFEPLESLTVSSAGGALSGANELECVGESIWANVYPTTTVIQIDKRSGAVIAAADLSSVIPAGVNPSDPDQVPNGIAYNPSSETFFVTGKLWPELLEVRFARPERAP